MAYDARVISQLLFQSESPYIAPSRASAFLASFIRVNCCCSGCCSCDINLLSSGYYSTSMRVELSPVGCAHHEDENHLTFHFKTICQHSLGCMEGPFVKCSDELCSAHQRAVWAGFIIQNFVTWSWTAFKGRFISTMIIMIGNVALCSWFEVLYVGLYGYMYFIKSEG